MTENGKPEGFLQIDVFTIDQARAALRSATAIILGAEEAYKDAIETAADAQATFRNELGEAFTRYRKDGQGVAEAEISARAEVAIHEHERDKAAGLLKLAAEKLEDARDTRRSLWRVIEWSARATTPAPEPRT